MVQLIANCSFCESAKMHSKCFENFLVFFVLVQKDAAIENFAVFFRSSFFRMAALIHLFRG